MPGATVGAALSGDVVRIEIAPLAAHVRTARLVSGATARRAGLGPVAVDELKLAVGEASTRAVRLHAEHAPEQLVDITMWWDRQRLTVAVSDRGPGGSQLPNDDTLSEFVSADKDDPGSGELALALVKGLVDDVSIEPRQGGGTVVTMSWPIVEHPAD